MFSICNCRFARSSDGTRECDAPVNATQVVSVKRSTCQRHDSRPAVRFPKPVSDTMPEVVWSVGGICMAQLSVLLQLAQKLEVGVNFLVSLKVLDHRQIIHQQVGLGRQHTSSD